MGYLPEALRNYLLRLGWGHGDIEIISTEEAAKIFALEDIGKGPARFDFQKLDAFNAHYLRALDDDELLRRAMPFFSRQAGRALTEDELRRLRAAMPGLKARAKTLKDLAESAAFLYTARPIPIAADAAGLLTDEARRHLRELAGELAAVDPAAWDETTLERVVNAFVERAGLRLKAIAQPLRVALTGRRVSPGIFEVLAVLGKDEALARIADVTQAGSRPDAPGRRADQK